jgi:5-methylcytosine-specific restriction endonuclease McrA
MRETTPELYIYLDGREVCRPNTAGRREYLRRRRVAWEQQKGICPLCGIAVSWEMSITDHKEPRGMGSAQRDDRQDNLQATHYRCNSEKGSRRI